ncbi:MAG: hypothetical protein ACFFD1_11135 [Candidatus Thorarchaeota archaeon]
MGSIKIANLEEFSGRIALGALLCALVLLIFLPDSLYAILPNPYLYKKYNFIQYDTIQRYNFFLLNGLPVAACLIIFIMFSLRYLHRMIDNYIETGEIDQDKFEDWVTEGPYDLLDESYEQESNDTGQEGH